MLPRELFVLATLTTLSVATSAASIDFDRGDYEVFPDTEEKSADDNDNETKDARLVRCYCNQPDCVSQSYLCMGRGCFTELPSGLNPASLRPEHSPYSGCLEKSLKERQCLPGFLCCEEDLCNHVDSPAVRSRLNKTLQVLVGDSRVFLGPMQPTGHGVQSTDGWFRTATIAVPICGLIVLLILASLAIRLLQPLPNQIDKLGSHRMPDNAPPLLGPPKVPLV
ncbi:BMP and activin membrane-bound inhibitor homolog [Belonocnema kinseyi]|uniref:BMP and activin membrane-bound inhibitor homolog n=1 Tax=Belonocnema kinseyi TaxID=2817044 RepID=UPI00143DE021|nr:BMP and activin membrane-bound inhibitor homolog [Belonocnema kinseyi]